MKLILPLGIVLFFLMIPVTAEAGLPDLAPVTLNSPQSVTNIPDSSITVSWTITNQGSIAAIGYNDGLYFSTNSKLDASAQLLVLAYDTNFPSNLGPGDSYSVTNGVKLPIWSNGLYYLVLVTDVYKSVAESNETNNIISSPVMFYVAPPDLAPLTAMVPERLSVSPTTPVTLIWAVTNLGPGGTLGFWTDAIYVSTNKQWTPDTTLLGAFLNTQSPSAGQTYWQTNTVRIPATITNGTYYLLFITDFANGLNETNFANNVLAVPVDLTLQPADLSPILLLAPGDGSNQVYPALTVVYGVTNLGPGVAEGFWTDSLILSVNDVQGDFDDLLLSIETEQGPLPPMGSYWRTNLLQLPVTGSGSYHLFLEVDSHDDLVEQQLSNNVVTVPVSVLVPGADVAPFYFQAPTVVTSPPNPTLTMIYGITNYGAALGTGYYFWHDDIYLSTRPVLDSTAQLVHSSSEISPFQAASDYWRSNSIQVPVTQNGTYYLILDADLENSISESNVTNNIMVRQIVFNILPPNLAPVFLQLTNFSPQIANLSMQVVWGVTNSGSGDAQGKWSDGLYLSSDAKLNAADVWLLDSSESGPVKAGEIYWRTNSLSVPFYQAASDYLIFSVNTLGSNTLFESDYADNTKAVQIAANFKLPDVAPAISRLPKSVTGPPYPWVTLIWGITNRGAGPVTDLDWWDRALFFSSNAILDSKDPTLVSIYDAGAIAKDGVLWFTNTLRLPVTNSGTYNFILRANNQQYLFESNYSNNVAIAPVDVTIQPPDLSPISLRAPASLVGPFYPLITMSWGVTNHGPGAAVGNPYWSDRLYLSTKPVWDLTAKEVFADYLYGNIRPAGSYWRTNTFHLPLTKSGTYYLFFGANSGRELIESSYLNNLKSVPLQFTLHPADLAPISVAVPTVVTGAPNPLISYSWGVTNRGLGMAQPYPYPWWDGVSLSTTNVWLQSDLQVGSYLHNDPFPSGGVYWQSNSVRVPVTTSGRYNLVFAANVYDYPIESNFTNNTVVVPVTFQIQAPDLAPIALQIHTNITALPNPSLAIVWGVTNQGVGTAGALDKWTDHLYFSSGTSLDSQAALVWSSTESNPVPPQNTYWRTNVVRIPVTQSGSYYLILNLDVGNGLYESNFSNNLAVVPVSFTIQNPPTIKLKAEQLLSDGSFVLQVSAPASSYTLETSDNLTNWVRAMDFICDGSVTLTNPVSAPAAYRFYRITPAP